MFRNETAELAAAASGSAGMGAVLQYLLLLVLPLACVFVIQVWPWASGPV